MKHPLITGITVIVLCAFIDGCNKEQKAEDQCTYYTNGYVRNVEGLNTLLTNQETDLKITFYFFSSCGKFEELQTTTTGNTTTVQVNEKDTGCVCSDVLTSGQTIYKFKAAQPGIYYIKFLQNNDRYLTDTITVN